MRGLQAFEPRKLGGERPSLLHLLASALLFTLSCAVLIWPSLPGSPHTLPSSELSVLWRILTPFVTPFLLWPRRVFIATLPAFLCLICGSDVATDLQLGTGSPGQPCVLAWAIVCASGEWRQVPPAASGPRGGIPVCPSGRSASRGSGQSRSPSPFKYLGSLVTVPAIEEDEAGEEVPARLDISVMLIDLELGALAAMRVFDPVTETGVHSFVSDAPRLVPQHTSLLQMARAWIEQEATAKLVFYSAQEDEAPAPAVKKSTPKAKRVTVSQLSDQVASLANLLPGLIDQVKSVVGRQDRLGAGAGAQAAASPATVLAKLASTPVCAPQKSWTSNAKAWTSASDKARAQDLAEGALKLSFWAAAFASSICYLAPRCHANGPAAATPSLILW